jgi:hypothetical protein
VLWHSKQFLAPLPPQHSICVHISSTVCKQADNDPWMLFLTAHRSTLLLTLLHAYRWGSRCRHNSAGCHAVLVLVQLLHNSFAGCIHVHHTPHIPSNTHTLRW